MPTAGTAPLPFLATVKPKLVEAPAAGLPFQLGSAVITLPLPSQVAVAFRTAVSRQGVARHPDGRTGARPPGDRVPAVAGAAGRPPPGTSVAPSGPAG
ncbi:hypothetical protein SUDANB145_00302 [Streptomyces sp. enrichment culture]|uniref:hypothetical protein n=1 Tax=Streptomyces sp. enrichment culture TaxID=1795815 RepID=UPI003F562087